LLDGISQISQALDLRLMARDLLSLRVRTGLEWPQTGGNELADIR
jgi:hypothetical protein